MEGLTDFGWSFWVALFGPLVGAFGLASLGSWLLVLVSHLVEGLARGR